MHPLLLTINLLRQLPYLLRLTEVSLLLVWSFSREEKA